MNGDVRFGSQVDKPSRAKIRHCPLLSESGHSWARRFITTGFFGLSISAVSPIRTLVVLMELLNSMHARLEAACLGV
jgi:hypothetical protein